MKIANSADGPDGKDLESARVGEQDGVVANPDGHAASLVPAPEGNHRALRHGVWSPSALQPRAREVAEALMEAPHTVDLDAVAAEEIGSLVALVRRSTAPARGRDDEQATLSIYAHLFDRAEHARRTSEALESGSAQC
jgi:hypothetical protein